MKYPSLVLQLGMASAQHCPKIDIDKSSGFCTVPDATLTPGEMDASLASVSNAERPRTVTNSEKKQSRTKYEVELLLWREVCVDKTLTFNQAKTAYLKGWTKLPPQK
jgi:hypothetical protein